MFANVAVGLIFNLWSQTKMSKDSVTITGVNKKQIKLLDKMWSIDEYDEYLSWKRGISTSDQREVELLEQLLLLNDIDSIAEEDISDAQQLLMTFSMGKG